MKIESYLNHSLIQPIYLVRNIDLDIPDKETDFALVISSEDKDIIGKHVYYNSFGYRKYIIDGKEHLFIKNEDILGICLNN